MNRPWTKWPLDETLAAVKAAGYATVGLLTRTKADPFIAADASPEYLEGLKRTLAASSLAANVGALRSRHDVPLEETLQGLRKEIDNAAFLGLKYVMTFGLDDPALFDRYFQAMAQAAAYGAEKGVQVVMKPHGGSSGASDEVIAAVKKVGHPNFRIWYDAGNIIYYTGQGPHRGAQADRPARDGVLRQGLRRAEGRGHDPVRSGPGGLRGCLQAAEVGGLQRADHGRMLCHWGHSRGNGPKRAREPRVPRDAAGSHRHVTVFNFTIDKRRSSPYIGVRGLS
jgi:hypothetical protein